MNTKINAALLAASFLIAAMPATAQNGATMVELRVDNVFASVPFAGHAIFAWDNQSVAQDFAVKAGDKIFLAQTFHGLPLATNQSITLRDLANATLLSVATTFDGTRLTVLNSTVDEARLNMQLDDASVQVVVGSVTGTFNTRVVFREAAVGPKSVTVAVDRNGDNTLEPSETERLTGDGPVVNGTIRVVDVPPTSAFSLSVEYNGTTEVQYHGSFDWLSGAFVTLERDRVDPQASMVLQRIELLPLRDSISGVYKVPNAMLLRSTMNSSTEPGSLPPVGLSLTFGPEEGKTPTPRPGGPQEPNSSPQPDDSLKTLALFVVAGTVLLIVAGLVAYLVRRKKTVNVRIHTDPYFDET